MKPTRKLMLKRETLAELTAEELRGVVGADNLSGVTCPVKDCVRNTDLICYTYGYTCTGCATQICQ